MPFDLGHDIEHADVAGWVIGALDPEDARSFEHHLRACAVCRVVVGELGIVAGALQHPAAPAAEPPADLEARTVAAVQYAVMAASRSAPVERKASRWWHVHRNGKGASRRSASQT